MINRFALSFLCIELDRNEMCGVMLVYILLRGPASSLRILGCNPSGPADLFGFRLSSLSSTR